MLFNTLKYLAVGCLALTFSTAQAATVLIRDPADTFSYGSLEYSGKDGDIRGFFNGVLDDLRASWYAAGDNAHESGIVGGLIGDPGLDLGGTEISLSGSTFTVEGMAYFTAKFGSSLAVFYNASAGDIDVTFAIDGSCKSNVETALGFKDNSRCGGLSHSKTTGPQVTSMPVPASLPLMAAGVALVGFGMRRAARRVAA